MDIDVAQHAEPFGLSAAVVLAKASSKDSPVSVVNPYMSDLFGVVAGREEGAACRTDRCMPQCRAAAADVHFSIQQLGIS